MNQSFERTPKQQEALQLLKGPELYNLLYGGSRSGKTFELTQDLITRALMADGSRHVIFRHRFNALMASMWHETVPTVFAKRFPGVAYYENKSQFFITLPNDSEIWFAGLDDKARVEKILGKEYGTLYFNEASQISYHAYTTAMTRLAQKTKLKLKCYIDCNPPPKSHWLYKLFIEHIDPLTKEPKNPAKYASLLMNPGDNMANLAAEYLETLQDLPARQRARFLEGKFLDDVEGALWSQTWIDQQRLIGPPELIRLAVGVDPSITGGENADECGIIVAGIDDNGRGYVLFDGTVKDSPHKWAQDVVRLYHHHHANMVVVEGNQGGELLTSLLRSVDPLIPIQIVHARQGKMTRAEPVSALYEQGRVSHCGYFAELEEQLTTYVADPKQKSPDRIDALVWALTWLMVKQTATPRIRTL